MQTIYINYFFLAIKILFSAIYSSILFIYNRVQINFRVLFILQFFDRFDFRNFNQNTNNLAPFYEKSLIFRKNST